MSEAAGKANVRRALDHWPDDVPLGEVRAKDGAAKAAVKTSPSQREALQAAGWVASSAGWWARM